MARQVTLRAYRSNRYWQLTERDDGSIVLFWTSDSNPHPPDNVVYDSRVGILQQDKKTEPEGD